MASYTTSDLLTSIKVRGMIPTSANALTDANLLALATEELHIKILPMLMSVREEFYVTTTDHAVTSGQAEYDIPTRASGLVLRDVQIKRGMDLISLPRLDVEDISTTGTGTPQAYYLRHNKVVLYPTPSSTVDSLRLRYFRRPSRLAATADCAQISSIDTGAREVVVSAIPSTWAVGNVVDFVKATVPYDCAEIDATITAIAGTTVTFASLPTGLATNDWLALAEYTPIPQIPHEMQPLLVQATVVKALEALGDREGAGAAGKDLQIIQQYALQLVTPRNQGEPTRIMPIWNRGRGW